MSGKFTLYAKCAYSKYWRKFIQEMISEDWGHVCVCVKVAQSCPTVWPHGYTVHGILQARIQEWVAVSFSRGSSQPRDWTQVPCIAGEFLTSWATREAQGHIWRMLRLEPPHSSTLAWKIPWMDEPGRLQSMGLLRVEHDWVTSFSLFTFMHWRRKWQPTPVFLPGESQGWGSLWAAVYGVTQNRTWLKWLSNKQQRLEQPTKEGL